MEWLFTVRNQPVGYGHANSPGKLLSYNCSPSFNSKKNLNDKTIAVVQEEPSALGYRCQFITLAGIHIAWYQAFKFAHAYVQGDGMKALAVSTQEEQLH